MAKAGVELPPLAEWMPFAAVVFADASITGRQQATAESIQAAPVPDGGTSIGRALRLRIESLLI